MDLRQVVVLRACGISAAPATGLDRLDGTQAVDLYDNYNDHEPMAVIEPRGADDGSSVGLDDAPDEVLDDEPLSDEWVPPGARTWSETPPREERFWVLVFAAWELGRLDGEVPPRLIEIARHVEDLFAGLRDHDLDLTVAGDEPRSFILSRIARATIRTSQPA